jgi:hypothetical protein
MCSYLLRYQAAGAAIQALAGKSPPAYAGFSAGLLAIFHSSIFLFRFLRLLPGHAHC